MNDWKLNQLRLVVTSRRELDIEEGMNRLQDVSLDDVMVSLETSVVDEDIEKYVNTELSSNPLYRKWEAHPELKVEIIKRLKKANGSFRWAVCQLETIGESLPLIPLYRSGTTQCATSVIH